MSLFFYHMLLIIGAMLIFVTASALMIAGTKRDGSVDAGLVIAGFLLLIALIAAFTSGLVP